MSPVRPAAVAANAKTIAAVTRPRIAQPRRTTSATSTICAVRIWPSCVCVSSDMTMTGSKESERGRPRSSETVKGTCASSATSQASAASDARRTRRWSMRGRSRPPTTTKPSTIDAATSRTQRSRGRPHSVCQGTTGKPSTVVCDRAPSVARMSRSTGTPASSPRLSRAPVESRAPVDGRTEVTARG